MNLIKKLLKELLFSPFNLLNILGKLYGGILNIIKPNLGLMWIDKQLDFIKKQEKTIVHKLNNKDIKIRIYTPNWVCRYRADTFSSKEPETLKWIDEYGGDGPLLDIGANVGLYSIYYAITKNSNVFAFEPSFFNLSLLARNINRNNVTKKIKIFPIPLSNRNGTSTFTLSNTDEGGALSAFGVNYGQDGKELNRELQYQLYGLKLDDLFSQKYLNEYPRLIKIDVDGTEHLILYGARKLLKNKKVKSILVEVNEDFKEQSDNVARILKLSGFKLLEKHHCVNNFYNQIWIKK